MYLIENKIDKLIKAFSSSDDQGTNRSRLVSASIALFEFAFFAYSASPKVNHTIRVCRMITTVVDFLNKQMFSYELKHTLFKFIHDNILEMLNKNETGTHREVESQYLLIVLSRIGREYWLPQEIIARHFLIEIDKKTGAYSRKNFLNHFSITVLLTYIQRKVRYNELRTFIEAQALEKLEFVRANRSHDAEALMLFLDLIVCPYIDVSTKLAAAKIFNLDAEALALVQDTNDYWFTAWENGFDLTKELDAKRSRDVY
jgi:hypothetical protein